LNMLRWHPKCNLREAKVTVLHRGAPRNIRVIEGREITELGPGFMRVAMPEGEVEIPYHRILQIEVRKQVFWKKREVY
jgi:uncharacterized protein (UPF0248 family)